MVALDWDDWNVHHIARHGIVPEEVVQVIQNEPFEVATYIRNGEERRTLVGETDAGRVLTIVTTERDELVRVVTAHPADRPMRADYRQMKEARDARDDQDPEI